MAAKKKSLNSLNTRNKKYTNKRQHKTKKINKKTVTNKKNIKIKNFKNESEDMKSTVQKACNIIENSDYGITQSELCKKLKITTIDGTKLISMLESIKTIFKEKTLSTGKLSYKLHAKKTAVETKSIETSPCLTCPVEQKCSFDGDISPKTCKLIEEWVIKEIRLKK